MEGEEEMREHLNLRAAGEGGPHCLGRPPVGSWGCVRLKRDYDTICSARFVLAAVDQALDMGAEISTHTPVLDQVWDGCTGSNRKYLTHKTQHANVQEQGCAASRYSLC